MSYCKVLLGAKLSPSLADWIPQGLEVREIGISHIVRCCWVRKLSPSLADWIPQGLEVRQR